jgi:hypothetical protein
MCYTIMHTGAILCYTIMHTSDNTTMHAAVPYIILLYLTLQSPTPSRIIYHVPDGTNQENIDGKFDSSVIRLPGITDFN